jgi:clan AA aspartic protease
MITGQVTAQLAPTMVVHVEDDNGQPLAINAEIDTGFSGYLGMPSAMISLLALTWITDRPFELADGTVIRLDVYAGTVVWDGQPRRGEIQAVGRNPIVGVKMLAAHEVRIRFVDGGPVWIDLVP